MTRLRHARVGFLFVPLWLGVVGIHLSSSGTAAGATTPFVAPIYSYDRDAPNAQSAPTRTPRAFMRVNAWNPTNKAQQSGDARFPNLLAAKAGAGRLNAA